MLSQAVCWIGAAWAASCLNNAGEAVACREVEVAERSVQPPCDIGNGDYYYQDQGDCHQVYKSYSIGLPNATVDTTYIRNWLQYWRCLTGAAHRYSCPLGTGKYICNR